MDLQPDTNVCVIGLGYVGLPLALAIAESRNVIGIDSNSSRVASLKSGIDRNLQFVASDLLLDNVKYQSDISSNASVYILTLPTPVNKDNTPDLEPLIDGIKNVGSVLKSGDLVIIESTVYPGVTEEVCVPLLEKASGLKACRDFSFGYSPERINPGDSSHDIRDVVKVVSGCCDSSLTRVELIYSQFVKPGVFKATSIKVAEAAKVIENTQRDLNIALVNELAMLFNQLDINTLDVLNAAGTKWNFHNYKPGLVGGHCIGVDPYYLTHKAKEIGFNPEIILAGRKINDQMHQYVANLFESSFNKLEKQARRVLILGLTFKENCPDFRNSGSVALANALFDRGFAVSALDPFFSTEDIPELKSEIEILAFTEVMSKDFDGIILSVAHEKFKEIEGELGTLCPNGIVMDIKGFLSPNLVNLHL